MKTCMFPGQGSQVRGMGGALFDEFPELTAQADAILGYSIKQLCLEDPRKELDNTRFTQPALFVVNALSYYKRLKDTDAKPDYLAGHSLGEFNALLAAEVFSFETGLKLVQKRGQLMSQVSGGGMAAVLNSTPDQIEAVLKENGLTNVELANFNTPTQIVISGLKDEVTAAQPLLQKGRVLFFPLNTSGAFHTRFLSEAQQEFRAFLQTFELAAPKIPVISNVTALPYESDAVVETLARQIASPVKWSDSVQYLLGLGSADDPMQFDEAGHGDVLTRLVKSIRDYLAKNASKAQETAAPKAAPAATAAVATVSAVAGGSTAEQKVAAWNQRHAVGTKVRSSLMNDATLETRTEALVLFGHRPAVYVKGYNGYFDIDEIAPA
ncbi:malonyl CoA-acyl carrier protein transacylase [Tahibacter aquaticus]|uniref:[acyl-carrier-protein] S-malonyltransferase n=1 Tax=Tahibacter aquaticus TaxID=520092 RepID=A0A4R6YMH5_9GAMM|nr:ACP S-malonyltransferase [Tahibacter aquaticus]TDR38505.1 malonyl CoA-acyl carrier protein transacylase [Tahibacter aquaticus]